MNSAILAPVPQTGPVFLREMSGSTLVLRPHCRLGSLQETQIVAETNELLEIINSSGPLNIVLDLAHDDYLGTAMVGAIVRLWKRVAMRGGRLALCNLSDTVHQVLRVTKLHAVWPIYATRDEALAAVS
ncbi:MAG: STAS domain-containing protein [Planctomycetaceae bacterium]